MKYSIDKVHEEKSSERGNGKTVDLLMDAIGMIMVTENKTVPIIVPDLVWSSHIRKTFVDIVISHFNEEPIIKTETEFHIKGFSSKVRVFSIDQWNEQGAGRGLSTTRTLYDY